MLLLCRPSAHRMGVFAIELVRRTARCWLFGSANGSSARETCGLWIPAAAYILSGFSSGMFHAIELVAGPVGVMSLLRVDIFSSEQ